jgi:1,4-alpha-glucan branching enzyme
MSKKKSKQKASATQKIKRKKAFFSIEAPTAEEVILMRDFNKWDTKVHPMKNDGNGFWSKTVVIPPGKYEYKFLIDGDWKEDPRNVQTCPNCFGTLNSILNLG